MFLRDPFGYLGSGLIRVVGLGEWEDLRNKFGPVFLYLEASFVCGLVPEDLFGVGGSRMNEAGVYGRREGEEVTFEQGNP